jgi:putative FmdB family regulatory protein
MTYEYLCEACGHQWEAEQSIKDRPLDKCVSCGAAKAKRLVSGGTGFLLKGGGWYADLYSSPGTGKAADDKGSKAGASKSDSSEAKSSGDSKSSGDGKAAASSTSSNASSTSTSTSASAPAPAAASAKAS